MPRRLPPLNALRAFEVAARHLSFTRAADELYVTQAAVSHQIKTLEEFLGVKLFRRLNRSLRLTDEGHRYLPPVRRAFDGLHDATRQLLNTGSQGTLTVSCMPSFAGTWLVPRLGRFIKAHPDIELRLAPSSELMDFNRDDVDVGIRYGGGRYPGLRADWLMTEELFPVCSPALLQGPLPLQLPADLEQHTLLQDDHGDWRPWLLATGVDDIDPERGPFFTDSGMMLQAAAAGQGVALARGALAADYLASGGLVKPFEFSLPSEYAYYVVSLASAAERPKIVAFREWLLREVQ